MSMMETDTSRYELWQKVDAYNDAKIEYMIWDLSMGKALDWFHDETEAREIYDSLTEGVRQ